jgi:hypothetical protein
MPRPRPPYPPEFRAEAVQLAHSANESIVAVARDLLRAEKRMPRPERDLPREAAVSFAGDSARGR